MERSERFAFRFDQIGKAAAVVGLAIFFSWDQFEKPGILAKLGGVLLIVLSLPIARFVYGGMGRFYGLDEQDDKNP